MQRYSCNSHMNSLIRSPTLIGLFYFSERSIAAMTDTLELCPFCGHTGKIIETYSDFYIRCSTCGAETNHFSKRTYGKAACASAVKAWNNRINNELAYIKAYLKDNIDTNTIKKDILCSLWTTYCVKNNICYDCYEYRRDINILWQIISKYNLYKNIEEFKRKLGRNITGA